MTDPKDDEPPTRPGRHPRPSPLVDEVSMPPARQVPPAWQHRESLMPARVVPASSVAATFIAGAAVVAYQVPSPLHRALLILACGLASWAIGYFTPPPRRHNRSGDYR